MAKRAGRYNTKLIRRVQSETRDATTGQLKEAFADGAELWAEVTELAGQESPTVGAPTAAVECEIRINGFPTLKFKDQFQLKGTNTYYTITGIVEGDNELIVSATRKQNR